MDMFPSVGNLSGKGLCMKVENRFEEKRRWELKSETDKSKAFHFKKLEIFMINGDYTF